MKKGKNWQKVEKNNFFEMKIDLKLRFDFKKCPDYQKKRRLLNQKFYWKFFATTKFLKIQCRMTLIECTVKS
jgi:hypothetical protein